VISSTSWLEIEQLLLLSFSTSGLMGSVEGERQEDDSTAFSVAVVAVVVVVVEVESAVVQEVVVTRTVEDSLSV